MGRCRQANPWDSLASQSRQIGEFQVSERLSQHTREERLRKTSEVDLRYLHAYKNISIGSPSKHVYKYRDKLN